MNQTQGTYRDQISTVDEKGKRVWLFPKIQKGIWHNRRKVLGYTLLAFLFAGPFIRIGGKQLILINILDRDFVIFGVVFHPQDTHLFALSMLLGVLCITLFTVVFGRLFCGWVCPHTIFMELVFCKIEYWIDGDAGAQRRLQKEGWTRNKIQKRT
ncbi:MAG: 4Fe-4S binding protein, partial [Flavobacteriales bacterium]|nr:4Fe-4S binding protein [Flavobacteriales bacterium]